jgi:acyl-[acyl-carrier-protein] desaturase
MRGWTSEENRHGDLLNAFLRLTGRVDMRAIEVTIQHLLANGFNPRAYPDPYCGLLYTSFQERATKLSHAHVGRLAQAQGNPHLAKICGQIAHDESRHEQFYKTLMGEVFARDPAGAVLSFRGLLRRVIAMPGRLMFDGKDPDLFEHFANVYTIHDYISIIRHLVTHWKIGTLSVTGKAAAAQDFLCAQGDRLESLSESVIDHVKRQPTVSFSWVNDRKA